MKSNYQPPKWAVRFFEWYCSHHLTDAVLGDLLELHARRCAEIGRRRANWLFVFNVILFLQPFALKKKPFSPHTNYIAMFRNFTKITWRNILKYKMYSAIKIGGFSLSIAICLLITLFVRDELSVDQHYENGELLYRVIYKSDDPADSWKGTSFPAPISAVLKENFPDIEQCGRLIAFDGWFKAGGNLFRPADQATNVFEERFAYADQEFIEMLQIPMVYGKRAQALSEPGSILISRRKAEKYFPNQNPVGKIVILNDNKSEPYVVGGVMENLKNTHIEGIDFLITLSGLEFWNGEQTSWCCWNYSPYIKVRPGTDPDALEEKLLSVRDNYIIDYSQKQGHQGSDKARKYHSLVLQPVGDIHLRSKDISDFLEVSDIQIVWFFAAIAAFILLLACVNFINLSTAKSANRAKEVGLRKVVGSHRGNLIQQFLTESVIFSAISVLLGVLLAMMAMPFFNAVAGKDLVFPITAWWFIPTLVLFALVIGLLSGLYPSFYLSSFRPISVLKGRLASGSKNSFLRSGLVVFQFTTSTVLIVGAFVVHQQMQFILNKKLGFNKEQVIMLHGTNTLGEKLPLLKEELLGLSKVKHVALSSYLPVKGTKRNGNMFWKDGRDKIDVGIGAQIWRVDPDYIDVMGMKLVEGRNFSNDIASDSAAIVINQTMAKQLGLKNPVGERIMNSDRWVVVGVVEDFHFETLKGKIEGLAMVRSGYGTILSVKVNTGDMAHTLSSITGVWDRFKPNQPIRYTFLDESYARMYADVRRTGDLFSAFAIFGIVVACLGLFGLSAFMVEQRGREISIRKVLGASVRIILKLLTLNFLRLVVVSLVLAVPIGWYIMDFWLRDFEYQIPLTWNVFAIAGFLVVLIATLTVGFESVKAALMNPANKLRSE